MKNLNKIILSFISIVMLSCNADDVENRPVIAAQTSPVLLTPTSDFNIILAKENENETATTVVWDDALYQGSSTIVNYTIQIAKKGTEFAQPITVSTTTDRFKALSVAELNSAMVNGGFTEKVENEVDIRIKSVVGLDGGPQYSNFYTFKATPYHTPLATSHWLVGAATPGGWTWDGDAETEFPLIIGRTDAYKVAIVLKSGEAFREFLANDFTSGGNWGTSHNYTFFANDNFTIDSELENAGDGDSNFRYTGPTAERVLTIDYAAKTITLD